MTRKVFPIRNTWTKAMSILGTSLLLATLIDFAAVSPASSAPADLQPLPSSIYSPAPGLAPDHFT